MTLQRIKAYIIPTILIITGLIILTIFVPRACAATDYQVRAMTSAHTDHLQFTLVYKDLLENPALFGWVEFRYQWDKKGWMALGPGGLATGEGFTPGLDLRGGYSPNDWFHALTIAQWFPLNPSGYWYLSGDTKLPWGLGRAGFETENLANWKEGFDPSLGIGPTYTLPFEALSVQLSYQFRLEEDAVARMLVIFPF